MWYIMKTIKILYLILTPAIDKYHFQQVPNIFLPFYFKKYNIVYLVSKISIIPIVFNFIIIPENPSKFTFY